MISLKTDRILFLTLYSIETQMTIETETSSTTSTNPTSYSTISTSQSTVETEIVTNIEESTSQISSTQTSSLSSIQSSTQQGQNLNIIFLCWHSTEFVLKETHWITIEWVYFIGTEIVSEMEGSSTMTTILMSSSSTPTTQSSTETIVEINTTLSSISTTNFMEEGNYSII